MIDPTAVIVLVTVAGVYVATSRTVPWWVLDALTVATMDPSMPQSIVRRAQYALREAEYFECEAA